MAGRVCNTCHVEKDIDEFPVRHENGKEWHKHTCKICWNKKGAEYARNYYQRNKDKVKKKNKRWLDDNREQHLEYHRKYNHEHKEQNLESARRSMEKKPEHYRKVARERAKRRRLVDADFRFKDVLRKRVNNALRGKGIKSARTMELIGCTMDQLRMHLQSMFKPGMTWQNHGLKGWHIDHIVPCSSFDLTKPEQQKACFHFSNLQPLWCDENWKKHAKVLTAK